MSFINVKEFAGEDDIIDVDVIKTSINKEDLVELYCIGVDKDDNLVSWGSHGGLRFIKRIGQTLDSIIEEEKDLG